MVGSVGFAVGVGSAGFSASSGFGEGAGFGEGSGFGEGAGFTGPGQDFSVTLSGIFNRRSERRA